MKFTPRLNPPTPNLQTHFNTKLQADKKAHFYVGVCRFKSIINNNNNIEKFREKA